MMKKKFFLGSCLFIVLIGAFSLGGYYTKPEEALLHNSDEETSVKEILATILVMDEPVTFYINVNNDISAVEYSKINIIGKEGWKMRSVSTLNHIKDIDQKDVIPTRMWIKKNKKNNPNRVLFGVSKSEGVRMVKINGIYPIFKSFDINGVKYILWYIVGNLELENPSISIDGVVGTVDASELAF